MVLNIKVEFEYGEIFEGLAFWDLNKGWIHSVVAETHAGQEKTKRTDPTEGLGVLLRDLSSARIGEMDRVVYVDSGKAKLAFWPDKQEWMALP